MSTILTFKQNQSSEVILLPCPPSLPLSRTNYQRTQNSASSGMANEYQVPSLWQGINMANNVQYCRLNSNREI